MSETKENKSKCSYLSSWRDVWCSRRASHSDLSDNCSWQADGGKSRCIARRFLALHQMCALYKDSAARAVR